MMGETSAITLLHFCTDQLKMNYRYKYCFTSSPTKPPSCTGPTIGDGSNHSGLAPSKFFRVLIEETVTAPVHLAKITAWKINIQTMTFQLSMKVDILTRLVTLSKNGSLPQSPLSTGLLLRSKFSLLEQTCFSKEAMDIQKSKQEVIKMYVFVKANR